MPASRSLIALLVGTVVFFALWLVALKPSSSSSGGGSNSSSQGLGAYQSDINKAKQAVATSNASNAASGNDGTAQSSDGASTASPKPATRSSSASHKTTSSSAKTGTKPAAKQSASKGTSQPTAAQNLRTVQSALDAHKVVTMLFYNPAAADDQAVRQELSSVPTHAGRVVKLAIPLSQAASFTAVTEQLPLNLSPTTVVVSPTRQVTEIVGYSDPFEIDQRVDDALAA